MHSNLQQLLLYILKCYKKASQNVIKAHQQTHFNTICVIFLPGVIVRVHHGTCYRTVISNSDLGVADTQF